MCFQETLLKQHQAQTSKHYSAYHKSGIYRHGSIKRMNALSFVEHLIDILSWSWLNIWFEPMGWLVLGHVTGINSATTTCQPWHANQDLCVFLAFKLIKNILNA